MRLDLRTVAESLGLTIASDALVTGWSVDSRTLQPGDLFFALRGPNYDGHAYLAEALQKGAAGAVVERDRFEKARVEYGAAAGKLLVVDDSLRALQTVSRRARELWGGDVVAVTGSAGKTTTKDVVADMLAAEIKTAKTEGNLNNHVGLPLSLLRLDPAAQVAVLEIGMNHAGEIRHLAAIAEPRVGLVTNVGYAHLENFESIDGVAAAKRELIESLPPGGIAVLNADDARVAGFASAHQGRTVLYGESPDADIRAEGVAYSPEGVQFRVGAARIESRLTGRHNLSNILAGIAVAGLYGISPHRLREKIRNLAPGKMRGERLLHRDIVVYNDCYNSNPDAVRAMLDVLKDTPARQRIAVLGEMLELGHWAEPLHRAVGKYAADSGINVLVGIRGAAAQMLDAAKVAGLRADAAFFFDDPAAAGRLVREIAQPGDAILFKGSRGVHVERALEEFLADDTSSSRGARN
jgi:UDP-N-acetylmuramoyl-tripeptide--D-alanyl-D-alanine ligase